MICNKEITFLHVPKAEAKIGITPHGLHQALDEWGIECAKRGFSRDQLKYWFEKELYRHSVTIESFFMTKYPLTNRQAKYILNERKVILDELSPSLPFQIDTYEHAQVLIERASDLLNVQFRLPTEFEWETAASGYGERRYPYGDIFDKNKANCYQSKFGKLTDVDMFEEYSSPLGFVDMAGNSEEWTESLYAPYNGRAVIKDFLYKHNNGVYRVMKGGNYLLDGDITRNTRRHGPVYGDDFHPRCMRLALTAENESDKVVKIYIG
jgi:toxoflavin biosynthesis protein ToxD